MQLEHQVADLAGAEGVPLALDDLEMLGDVGGEDGLAVRHLFQDRDRQALGDRRMGREGGRSDQRRELGPAAEAGEDDVFAALREGVELLDVGVGEGAVADDGELEPADAVVVGAVLELLPGLDQGVGALVAHQARDHHDVFAVREAELLEHALVARSLGGRGRDPVRDVRRVAAVDLAGVVCEGL